MLYIKICGIDSDHMQP